jgi:RNA polymerase-associated protein CTR9
VKAWLPTLRGVLQEIAPTGSAMCVCSTRIGNALEVFSKVQESMNDATLYVNIGHAHYTWDEYDRAIESVRVIVLV